MTAFLLLAWRAGDAGIATGWVDPVAKIQAQDEAVYANTSLGMAQGKGWLTPKFLGRLALYKPPLLYWVSGLSIKALGWSNFSLRLPSLLAGAGMVTMVFLWLYEDVGLWQAVTGALLTLSTHLVFAMSRVGMTDALLGLFTLFALFHARKMGQGSSGLWFAIGVGLAVMVKSIAGVIPVLAAVLYWAESGRKPKTSTLLQACVVIVCIILPWHIYQYMQNPHWFWDEHVRSEIFLWGLNPQGQTTQESAVWFYGRRLAMLDPFLLVAALVGAFRRRSWAAFALAQAVILAVLAFQYRNASYLLPLYPAMAMVAASGLPPRSAFAGALVVAGLKLAAVPATWALPFAPEFVNPSYVELDRQAMSRPQRELVLGDPDDQFYSGLLPIRKVRYAFQGVPSSGLPQPVDFERLGIMLTVAQWSNIAELAPEFQRRLREFDLDSSEPIGTGILYNGDGDVSRMLREHPEVDFYVPEHWSALDGGVHSVTPGVPGRVWLRAK